MKYLLPTFLVLPVMELYFLIQVGGSIGPLNTIALVFLTAIAGFMLVKSQGFKAITRAKEKLTRGELPTEEIFTGLFLVISGVLLITPGFVTDSIGFFFLIPQVRKGLFFIIPQFITVSPFEKSKPNQPNRDWIEGEYEKKE